MNPQISVIIPTYNRASLIQRAIHSVFRQSFGDWELIVVDDGSTDSTQDTLISYTNHSKVRLFKTENRGVSAARNLGIRQARGTWIAFLDSDDEWLPTKLEKQMEESQKHPEIFIIHGDEIWIRKGLRVNPMKKHQKKGGDIFHQALKLCCISPSTVFIKKNLFEKIGGFREDFPVCEDYDLWLRITSRYPVGYIDDFLIKKHGDHLDQLSRQYKAMDYWRVLSLFYCLSPINPNPNPISHKLSTVTAKTSTTRVHGKWRLNPKQQRQAKNELLKKGNILLKGYRKHENLKNFDRIFAILNFYGDDDSQ